MAKNRFSIFLAFFVAVSCLIVSVFILYRTICVRINAAKTISKYIEAQEQYSEKFRPAENAEVDMLSATIEDSDSKTCRAVNVQPLYDRQDAEMIAKLMYKECADVRSKTQQACVIWTVLNRADAWGKTIAEVVTAPGQFAYHPSSPIEEESFVLAEDVLERWSREQHGEQDVGRVLPVGYMWFWGDGVNNHFRNAFRDPFEVWDYSLPSPYDS